MEMKHLCWVGLVLCLSLVDSGFISVHRDHVVQNDSVGKVVGDTFETNALESNRGVGDDADLGRGLLPASKDVLMPLLTGLMVKVLTVLPLVLIALAVVAGFSLAASKVALLLGGALMLYHYISETQLLLPVSNKGGFSAGSASFHPPGHFAHPELAEYIRDRNLNLNPSVGT